MVVLRLLRIHYIGFGDAASQHSYEFIWFGTNAAQNSYGSIDVGEADTQSSYKMSKAV